MKQPGQLYIVATPIGNLADITLRALQILSEVDFIAAEDTRYSRRLLNHHGITTRLISLYEHNEACRSQELLANLQAGQQIALISDAGTPLISDPGYRLVMQVVEADITVTPIPGPCALTAALSCAGLPTDRFVFEGFLPTKSMQRQLRLENLIEETRTLIFYESPHRLMGSLQAIANVMGCQRHVVLAKELTKSYEQMVRGTVTEVIAWLDELPERQQGEFVILIHGAAKKANNQLSYADKRILEILLTELSVKQAAKLTASITGGQRNDLYELALQLKDQS
ncbi:MAG: 16S rRNA (cytidine(1402)-2'-O)-methyltransferase [Legionellales bacterium]|nr:16S rRNA (cytidine(1402)-2'-O)-methyltransferase [Legionellales bacterium]